MTKPSLPCLFYVLRDALYIKFFLMFLFHNLSLQVTLVMSLKIGFSTAYILLLTSYFLMSVIVSDLH